MVTSGAQAPVQFERLAARLKSCPDTCFVVDTFTAAAKAVLIEAEDAGINACSTPQGTQRTGIKKGMNACSTLRGMANGKIRKGMNACSAPRGMALRNGRSINACSTPWGMANGKTTKGINACSTPWGKNFQGLKPQNFSQLDAALKGRSSTMQFYAADSLCSPLSKGKGWGRSSTLQSATMGVR
jgi:hypothetical protein